jgi:hypothetical protein
MGTGIAAEWGTSANNRKAKFYSITKAGRKQLAAQAGNWVVVLHGGRRFLCELGTGSAGGAGGSGCRAAVGVGRPQKTMVCPTANRGQGTVDSEMRRR